MGIKELFQNLTKDFRKMSSPDNFEYFTHEIERTHDMTQ